MGKVLFEKAKVAFNTADTLREEAKKAMITPPELSEEFIRSSFLIDPEDGHYSFCSICGLSGDVICCEKCPTVMHPKCAGLDAVPEEDWFCKRCTVPCDSRSDGEGETNRPAIVTNENELDLILAELRRFRHSEQPTRYKKSKQDGAQTNKGAENQSKGGEGQKDDTTNQHSIKCQDTIENNKSVSKSSNAAESVNVQSQHSEGAVKSSKEESLDQLKIKISDEKNTSQDVQIDSKMNSSNASAGSSSAVQPIEIGSKIFKHFGNAGYFLGVIRSLPNDDHPFYGIKYEDGDEEDMDESELREVLIVKTAGMKGDGPA